MGRLVCPFNGEETRWHYTKGLGNFYRRQARHAFLEGSIYLPHWQSSCTGSLEPLEPRCTAPAETLPSTSLEYLGVGSMFQSLEWASLTAAQVQVQLSSLLGQAFERKNEPATKAAIDEDGWFHTGDLGYYDESEQVYLVVRLKDLVKMMGMQVSPSEVEDTILSIPGVLEAAVVGVTKNEEIYELLAFVVKQKDSAVTEKLIQEHVAGALSQYKHLTGGVVFVESLPKTSSGKLEKKEIRKLAQELYLNRHQRDKVANGENGLRS